MIKQIVIVALLAMAPVVQADLQIEIRDGDGRNSTVSSNGKQARMSDARESTYLVIDYSSGLFSLVDPQRRQVMQASAASFAGLADAGNKVKINLINQGPGPQIAGFATQKFSLSANDKHCTTLFGSKAVLEKKGLSELMDVMNRFQQQSQRMMGGFRNTKNICTQAQLQMAETYQTTGAPLRILDEHGQLESEVTGIDSNKSVSSDYYDIPANFDVVNIGDQMKQSGQAMQGIVDEMPDMNAIMQQLQQSGEVTPEMIEQMKKMKQRLKQQYQE
ncbi:MAG: hypothetical protein ACI9KN_000367 [Gammaproteobacteria bacterium]|jgi:uncharacterized protein YdcH (DUF465 family)